MTRAVAYYRTRPSEPEASDLALRSQQEAVRREVEQDGLTLVAEFIEREGEEGSETYPAYIAALRAAASADGGSEDMPATEPTTFAATLLIATHAAIGTGGPFQEPAVESAISGRVMYACLQAPTIPFPCEIPLPAGAPSPLCLYVVRRPDQLDTLIYLCNGGSDAMTEVMVTTDTISDHQFCTSAREKRWTTVECTNQQRWVVILPSTCVLVSVLHHVLSDVVNRYCVAFVDTMRRCWKAEADDLALRGDCSVEKQSKTWFPLSPVSGSASATSEIYAAQQR